eukprot:scaffold388_cov380-Prasinococcus_capsulatus_cf.AAC.10
MPCRAARRRAAPGRAVCERQQQLTDSFSPPPPLTATHAHTYALARATNPPPPPNNGSGSSSCKTATRRADHLLAARGSRAPWAARGADPARTAGTRRSPRVSQLRLSGLGRTSSEPAPGGVVTADRLHFSELLGQRAVGRHGRRRAGGALLRSRRRWARLCGERLCRRDGQNSGVSIELRCRGSQLAT